MELELNYLWYNYVLKKQECFEKLWGDLLKSKNRKTLMIFGLGFDPRTNHAIKIMFDNCSNNFNEFIILRYFKNEMKERGKYFARVENNRKELEEFFKKNKVDKYKYFDIIFRSKENKVISSRNALKILDEINIEDFNDIIVDVSAMPIVVFFPLIYKLLKLIKEYEIINKNGKNRKVINLHVVATENYKLDAIIKNDGLDEEATYIHGFGSIEFASSTDFPKIWIPLLGEGQSNQIEYLRKKSFDEICPLLPFPSVDLRRGDNLMTEYRNFFIDTLNLGTSNILFADEQNPFQVYRILMNTINRYVESFDIIKGCKIVISPLSSKLLSLGALLAAYECRESEDKRKKLVGVMQVDSLDHVIKGGEKRLNEFKDQNELFGLWLTGEPYEN